MVFNNRSFTFAIGINIFIKPPGLPDDELETVSPGHVSLIRAIAPHCNSPFTQTCGQSLKPGGSVISGHSGGGELEQSFEPEDELLDDELLDDELLLELEVDEPDEELLELEVDEPDEELLELDGVA